MKRDHLYLATCAFAATAFLAAPEAFSMTYSDVSRPAPTITGGIADDERAEMEQVQNRYNLKLVLTGLRGDYVSDVDVKVEDKYGNLLVNNTTDGPIMLTNLPDGRYTVTASLDGQVRKQVIAIHGGKLKTMQMRFVIPEDTQQPI